MCSPQPEFWKTTTAALRNTALCGTANSGGLGRLGVKTGNALIEQKIAP
jgi:hypothetical protein